MQKTQVSVIMPSYNHAAYIQEAIDSVLSQTHVELELLICDDCSSDNSAEVIRKQTDSRISYTIHKKNIGACTTLNELISQARSNYIALINSDDIWNSTTKLAEQLELLETNPNIGASFGKATFIDEQSNPIPDEKIPFRGIFDKPNQSRTKWFRAFFEKGNSLCHPTMLIRKNCYTELGGYNNRYRQLPDMDMWMRVVQKYDIHISDKAWVQFRLNATQNTSAPTIENGVRSVNEAFLIASKLLDEADPQFLIEAFPEQFQIGKQPSQAQIDIARAIPFLNVQKPELREAYHLLALSKLKPLLEKPEHAAILREEYEIDDHWFHQQMGQLNCLTHHLHWQIAPNDAENEKLRINTEIEKLKQLTKTQSDLIANLQKNEARPLLALIAKRLLSKIF